MNKKMVLFGTTVPIKYAMSTCGVYKKIKKKNVRKTWLMKYIQLSVA
jgi:hypothetical protein